VEVVEVVAVLMEVPMEVPMVVRMAVAAVAAVAAVGAQWSSTTAPLVEALEAGALEAVQEAWVATRVVDVGCVVDMDMNRAAADTGSSPYVAEGNRSRHMAVGEGSPEVPCRTPAEEDSRGTLRGTRLQEVVRLPTQMAAVEACLERREGRRGQLAKTATSLPVALCDARGPP